MQPFSKRNGASELSSAIERAFWKLKVDTDASRDVLRVELVMAEMEVDRAIARGRATRGRTECRKGKRAFGARLD